MFKINFLKKMSNDLEELLLLNIQILKLIKSYLENINNPIFVRMTGSGSALVAYYFNQKKDVTMQKKCLKKI